MTKETTTMGREEKLAQFGEGPWLDEPDRVEWRAHGFACLLRRVPSGGYFCGYVAVPAGHPWHGGDDESIVAYAHGRLNYFGTCNETLGVCHVPEPGEPDDVYWVGFDAGHGNLDVIPRFSDYGIPGVEYRGVPYMRAAVEALAVQAAVAAQG